MKNDIIKKILSFVLLFLLIVSFTISVLTIVMESTILNKRYVTRVIEENNYYSKTYNSIMEKFKDNTIQSGLEESILEGIITEEQVKQDTLIMIDNIYENSETKVDKEIVKTRLKEKINKIIEENRKRVSLEEQEAINIYVNTIENIYEDGILYKQEYIDNARTIMLKAEKYTPIVIGIGIVSSLAIIIVMGIINRIDSLKFFSSTLISSGILLCVPKIMESLHINSHNILLFNMNFSTVIINIVERTFMSSVICGIVIIVVGLLINVFNIENKKD